VRVKVGEQLREIWRQATGSGREADVSANRADAEAERKTLALPSILSPVQFPGRLLPKPTPANLRRFAEIPVVRRAINVIKDRIAAMDWQVRVRRGVRPGEVADVTRKLTALRRTLEEPNAVDSFRTLIEQVIEDALTGGFGAIEMEPTGDGERPAMLWAVDGASIRINAKWDGDPDTPRYAQVMPGQLESGAVDLRDDQLMYVRMNPRSFTPFGLGPLEVAFETVNQFLSAHRYAGKLAANAVAQYALWMAVDYRPGWDGHDARRKIGLLTEANVIGQRLMVRGYLYARDFPEVAGAIEAHSPEAMGMSYELADAQVEDMRAEIWKLTRVTFTGAAILLRDKAAYRATSFRMAS